MLIHNRKKRAFVTALAGLAWAVALVAGLRFMVNYERTPGRTGNVAAVWPAESTLKRASDEPTLLVFAHPRCPCTRATMDELAQVVAHTQGKLRVSVVFFRPLDSGDEWTDTDLEQTAAAIPGVTVLTDPNAIEARRFGAETSGHALLFAADGHLLFSGGITASRGHAGDNVGESAIVSIVNGRSTPLDRSFVFGCSIRERDKLARNSRN